MKKFASLLFSVIFLCSPLGGCAGNKAPQIEYQTIKGELIRPADYRGQVMVINFWATSCATCVKEMPQLTQTHLKYKNKGFRTIAVAMHYDRPDYVVNFTQTRQLPFDVVLDVSGHISKAFDEVKLTPTTYVINRKGEIIKTYVGEPDFAALHELLEKCLSEKV